MSSTFRGTMSEQDIEWKEESIEADKSQIIIVKRRFLHPRFKPYISVASYTADIKPAQTIMDFAGHQHKDLQFSVTAFARGGENGDYWRTTLQGENYLGQRFFNPLGDRTTSLDSYSTERLKQWQDTAKKEFDRGLIAIEELYHSQKPIPQDFLGLK